MFDPIAHDEVPRYIRFVDALPMTISAKAQTSGMRSRMLVALGLTQARTA